MKITKTLLFIVALMCVHVNVSAAIFENKSVQTVQADSVKNKKTPKLNVYCKVMDFMSHAAVDSLEGELILAKDSSFVDSVKIESYDNSSVVYANFYIKAPGDYYLRLRAKGYRTIYYPASFPKLHKHETWRELKPAYMHRLPKEREVNLGEVVVKATKLKFYMDGDTLVYDADAFNLAEGSMLDGLIKRLPGVTLSKEGEITVNGKKVDALLLNGKDFFDSERNIMLENLPAYMVKDVQAYERTPDKVKGSVKEKTTEKEMVMNVKLKKEYNGGWIANAEAGIGAPYKDNWSGKRDTKFLGRMVAIHFNDVSRFMLYANANNLNDYRSPGDENGEWSPLQQSSGLTTIYKVGMDGRVNFGHDNSYEGSLSASYSDILNENHSNGSSFLLSQTTDANGESVTKRDDTFSRSMYSKRSYDYRIESNHWLSLRKGDDFLGLFKNAYLTIRPSFSYLDWDNLVNSASVSLAEDVASQLGKDWLDSVKSPVAGDLLKKYAIDRKSSTTKGVGHYTSVNVYGYGGMSPKYNDKLSIYSNFNYSFYNQVDNDYQHYRLDYPKSGKETVWQNKFNPSVQQKHEGRISIEMDNEFTENFSFSVEYGANLSWNRTNKHLYWLQKLDDWDNENTHPLGTLPSMEEKLKTLDADNSKVSTISTFVHHPNLGWNYMKNYGGGKYCWANINLDFPVSHESMDYWQGSQADTTLSRNTFFVVPRFNYMYNDQKRGKQIRVTAYMNTSAPSLTYLLDVHDTSNPQYSNVYNPDLKNTTSWYIHNSYRDKFGRTLFNASLGLNLTRNAIGNKRVVRTSDNHTTSTPMNINGNWSVNAGSGISFPLTKDEKWRLDNNVAYNFNNSVDFSGTDSLDVFRSVVRNHNTKESVNIVFRPTDKVTFSAKGSLSWQVSTSDRTEFTTINAYTYDYGVTAQVELPLDIQLSTDVTMYSRRGYDDDAMNTNELVWNARLSKRLMKGNLILQLDGFDMLGNLSNVYRNVNAQGKTETFYNVIPSYCLVHAIWRLNRKPKKKD